MYASTKVSLNYKDKVSKSFKTTGNNTAINLKKVYRTKSTN